MFRVALLIIYALSALPSFAADEPARGDSLYFVQHYTEAVKEFKKFVKKHPNHARTWYRLGFSELKSGEYAEAEKALSRANELGFNVAYTNFNLACALSQQGKLELATEKLRASLDAGYPFSAVEADPDLENLRASESWPALFSELEKSAKPCDYDTLYRQFDFWIGEWDVFLTNGGNKVGDNIITKEQNGCLLRENWTSISGNTGTSTNYVNPETRKWNQIWHGASGNYTYYEGEWQGGAMRFTGTNYDYGKVPEHMRMTFTPNADGSVRQLIELQNALSEEWTVSFDGTYKRKEQ